ncbi:MAG: hypothetical protein IT348_19585 [Candidatus Eisenbacteria bacterium]|nr:hypothetical protein [Candidatus Eisenbacteria bacterium]
MSELLRRRGSALRGLLVFAAASLLALSALAPRLRADAQQEDATMLPYYPYCTQSLVYTGGNAFLKLSSGSGFTQPFTFNENVGACSLGIERTNNNVLYRVIQWDPTALAPDPSTVALRSVVLLGSVLYWQRYQHTIYPPLIVRSLAHVADAPGMNAALDLQGLSGGDSMSVRYAPAGSASMPTGLTHISGIRAPFPGTHPVVATSLCAGDWFLRDLRIAQAVTGTDVTMDSTRYQLVQRFRVPRSVRLQWVELALTRARYGYGDGAVAILDGADGASPPASISSPLVSTSFYPSYTWSGPGWTTPNDFDSLLVLHPNHDYWLLVTTAHDYPFGAHALTGSESADFTAGIGPFWSRANASDAWTAETGRALSFKLIADTTSLAAVEPPPARGALRLEVSPNPSRGTSVLSWNGAAGAVRLEVLDARGRRVASHTGGAAGAGQWTWSVAGAREPLPAGLYFVRATDARGHAAVARVALIR